MYCYHCDILLTNENESVEHIIPNAIGGRLKSKKLLCKSCNSLLGELYDSELCKSLMVISGVLDIKRQKGVTQDIKNVRSDSGRLYNLVNGRHPVPIAPEIKINEADNNVPMKEYDLNEALLYSGRALSLNSNFEYGILIRNRIIALMN